MSSEFDNEVPDIEGNRAMDCCLMTFLGLLDTASIVLLTISMAANNGTSNGVIRQMQSDWNKLSVPGLVVDNTPIQIPDQDKR